MFQLPTGSDDFALMLTADYAAALQVGLFSRFLCCCLRLLTPQLLQRRNWACAHASRPPLSAPPPLRSPLQASMQALAPSKGAAADVFDWFRERVLPACCEVMITHGELLALLGGRG